MLQVASNVFLSPVNLHLHIWNHLLDLSRIFFSPHHLCGVTVFTGVIFVNPSFTFHSSWDSPEVFDTASFVSHGLAYSTDLVISAWLTPAYQYIFQHCQGLQSTVTQLISPPWTLPFCAPIHFIGNSFERFVFKVCKGYPFIRVSKGSNQLVYFLFKTSLTTVPVTLKYWVQRPLFSLSEMYDLTYYRLHNKVPSFIIMDG